LQTEQQLLAIKVNLLLPIFIRVAMDVSDSLQTISLKINGVERTLAVEPRVSLLDALRDHLGLHGTKKGCNQGACGACTVLADGERINSCLTFAVQYEGCEIVTIEGLAKDGELHPLQQAFIEHDGFQCGYCTPGQICSAVGMLSEFEKGFPSAVTHNSHSELTEIELRERMSGNICRCGAYVGIREAIQQVHGAGKR
jgi:xanthine dehydrogenase YagT iron-sulfur-binding subunit